MLVALLIQHGRGDFYHASTTSLFAHERAVPAARASARIADGDDPVYFPLNHDFSFRCVRVTTSIDAMTATTLVPCAAQPDQSSEPYSL